MTTNCPSAHRRTSNSNPVAPHSKAFLNDAIVFSPRRGYPGAPRCPNMIMPSVYSPPKLGGVPSEARRGGSLRNPPPIVLLSSHNGCPPNFGGEPGILYKGQAGERNG